MAAIQFLTTVSRSVHHHLFKDAGALQKVLSLLNLAGDYPGGPCQGG